MSSARYEYTPDEEFYQSDEWQELRADIIERDGFMCRVCQSIDQLSVHHIIPRKYKYAVRFDIDCRENLVTLCWRHHGMADRKVDRYGRQLED